MKIDVNANSLRRLIRLMRTLADELENVCDKNKEAKSKGFISALMAVPDDESDIIEIIEHYKKIHPGRKRYVLNLNSKHNDWKLIKKRLKQGYKVQELKSAISNNSIDDFWVKQGLHGIDHVMKKDSNLEKFINNPKRKTDATSGHSSGSQDFSGDTKGFGD